MVLARKESVYIQEQVEEKQQYKTNRNKNPKKNYRFEKIIITISMAAVLASSILMLTRFLEITEAKHRVNSLQNQIERSETEREKLRVEVEKVSRSGWIESEAKLRLDMVYPSQDQMMYININPTEVEILNSEISKVNNINLTQAEENKSVNGFFAKLVSYIRI